LEKKLKRTFVGLLLSIIIISITLGVVWVYEGKQITYKDGIYYSQAYGYYSQIKVKVVIESGKICQIDIIDHEEPEILANIVFDRLPNKMIKKNTSEVDIVSGATYTSKSLIKSVRNALLQASIPNE
jgi:uncharacterized protein with FMN-binding domain